MFKYQGYTSTVLASLCSVVRNCMLFLMIYRYVALGSPYHPERNTQVEQADDSQQPAACGS